jgi:hypothetical protein
VTAARPAAATRAVAASAVTAALVAACGCDNPYQQFLGSIPTEEVDPDAPVEVFLGVDGLSKQAFDLARAQGAFADYHAADLITPFPGTSDYSWTRTLRAGALGGYELQYFDPQANSMENRGLVGVAEHPLREGIAGTLPAYQRFDFLGDGETWMLDSYLDPVASLRPTLDQMFDTIAARGRTKSRVLAYLLNVDVVGHLGGLDQAVTMLVEIDRRIRAFKAGHRRRFQFTLFADHGNAHQRSLLADPVQILTDVGVASVDALSPPTAADAAAPPPLEAVAVVHVRVNYVALHAARHNVVGIAARTSRHPYVDLAVARLADDAGGAQRFGIWRQGVFHRFSRDAAGTIVVDDPDVWCWLGMDFGPWRDARGAMARLTDRQAFDATVSGPYPDIFYRVATAFTHGAARFPADILLSMPDNVASYGFAIPGAVADVRAADGFHGALSRASTLSVVASDSKVLPPAVRSDDLADMFPILRGAD